MSFFRRLAGDLLADPFGVLLVVLVDLGAGVGRAVGGSRCAEEEDEEDGCVLLEGCSNGGGGGG